jgi:phosphatidylglycerol:prolipoprotein diacylglycerol transferase
MHPVLLDLGFYQVRSYGVMVALAFLAAALLASRIFPRFGLPRELVGDLVVAAVVGGILGARAAFVLAHLDYYSTRPAETLALTSGGLVWYGGLAGGALTCLGLVLKRKLPAGTVAGALAPSIALGHAIGRIGCLLNGDDYGLPTDSWLGMAFPRGTPPTRVSDLLQNYPFLAERLQGLPRDAVVKVVPTQVFEALAMFLSALLLLFLLSRLTPQATFGACLVLLGGERFVVEFWRLDGIRNLLGPLSSAQVASLLLVGLGALLLFRGRTREGLPSLRQA